MTSESVGARLQQARHRLGFSQKNMASKLDIGLATWQRIENDANLPNADVLVQMMRMGIDPGWLLTGEGQMEPQQTHNPSSVVAVPILSVRASAGPGSIAEDEGGQASDFIEVDKVLMTRLGLKPHQTSALTIQGDSAMPTLSDGDLVLVDRSQDYPQDGLLYVIGIDNDLIVKRIHRLVDGGLLLKSDNASYDAQKVASSDAATLRIIGRVKYALHAV